MEDKEDHGPKLSLRALGNLRMDLANRINRPEKLFDFGAREGERRHMPDLRRLHRIRRILSYPVPRYTE